jgi:hypothetical protein
MLRYLFQFHGCRQEKNGRRLSVNILQCVLQLCYVTHPLQILRNQIKQLRNLTLI